MLLKGGGDDTAAVGPTRHLPPVSRDTAFERLPRVLLPVGKKEVLPDKFRGILTMGRIWEVAVSGKLAPTHCSHHRTVPQPWNPRAFFLPVAGEGQCMMVARITCSVHSEGL